MRNKGYFQGWYFKCSDGDKTVAFIPAYHRNQNIASASLQIITDDTAYHIPFKKMEYANKPLSVKIGDCEFTEKGIALNFQSSRYQLEGLLRFRSLSPIAYDIMVPFAFVPFMQCRHGVYSMMHRIDGRIILNDQTFDFHNGVGYIEGDRGYSFPKRYIWTQCCFENGSLMLSIANIPMLGFHFTGIIGVVLLNGREYRIATYLGASIKGIGENAVTVKQGEYEFTAELLKKNAHPLFAPTNGNMSRTIHESASCKARYHFSHKNEVLCDFVSEKASFEFEYFDGSSALETASN
ncbi:MAG: hypothetical protein IJX80_07970 [Clostridia bacterium]|nr:hypothetical protein [Clostridia bacterium]